MAIKKIILTLAFLLAGGTVHAANSVQWCELNWNDGERRYVSWFYIDGTANCNMYDTTKVEKIYSSKEFTAEHKKFAGGVLITLLSGLTHNESNTWISQNKNRSIRKLEHYRNLYFIDTPADISTILLIKEIVKDDRVVNVTPNWHKALMPR